MSEKDYKPGGLLIAGFISSIIGTIYNLYSGYTTFYTIELSPIFLVLLASLIIGQLIWGIIACVQIGRRVSGTNQDPLSVGFKVCVLIFVSALGGILLLCDSTGRKSE